jgi:aspartyl-tRNA(Asn)/glutamyl-tRNA(Gln) amidotransferase subunit C
LTGLEKTIAQCSRAAQQLASAFWLVLAELRPFPEHPMSLTADQIRQVAHLARLELKAGQVDQYARELSNILEMVGRLARADTAGAEPMAHPLDMSQRLRPDAVTEPDRREALQAHAPAVKHGLYVVPKVIE